MLKCKHFSSFVNKIIKAIYIFTLLAACLHDSQYLCGSSGNLEILKDAQYFGGGIKAWEQKFGKPMDKNPLCAHTHTQNFHESQEFIPLNFYLMGYILQIQQHLRQRRSANEGKDLDFHAMMNQPIFYCAGQPTFSSRLITKFSS